MATIKEIADRLGISVSTVSKGLNGASDISEELRQMVLDTAVEVGYTTKRSRKKENRKFCVLVENMEYSTPGEFGYEIILGFRQNAFRNQWDVEIVEANRSMQEEEKYDNFLLRNKYSGAFIVGFALDDPWMKQFRDTTMPTVLLDNFIPRNPNVCCVGTDSNEGIGEAVDYLYNLGHRKIALLNGSEGSLVTEDRQKAYESALTSLGLTFDPKLSVYGYYVEECAKFHMPQFLENGATAIVCGNDLIAKGCMDYCAQHGYSVPEDISVVGFDDISLAANLNPPLTTVRQDTNEIGRSACVALSSLVHHIPISRTIMRPTFVVRESTAKCKIKKTAH